MKCRKVSDFVQCICGMISFAVIDLYLQYVFIKVSAICKIMNNIFVKCVYVFEFMLNTVAKIVLLHFHNDTQVPFPYCQRRT
jgi:hypothetical protein